MNLWDKIVQEDSEKLTLETLKGDVEEANLHEDNFKISALVSLIYGLIFSALSMITVSQAPEFKNANFTFLVIGVCMVCTLYSTLTCGAPVFGMLYWKSKKRTKTSSHREEVVEEYEDIDKAA